MVSSKFLRALEAMAERGFDVRQHSVPPNPKSALGERLTEDEIARANLGGVKGSPDLPPAPLTKTEREQIFLNDDDGHWLRLWRMIDLCIVPTVTFERLFAFLIVGHDRRRLWLR